MKLIYEYNVKFILFVQLSAISYQDNFKHSKYYYNYKHCQLSETPLWQTTDDNAAACFNRCHGTDNFVSVSYNPITSECYGFKTCSKRCDGEPSTEGWRNYCKGGM